MKTILVPSNFSECAESAVRFAIELANETKAKIILLTVLKAPEPGNSKNKFDELTAMDAKRKFETLLEAFPSHKHLFYFEIQWGRVVPIILRQITEQKIDIVVMGSQGSRGWEDFFMGSNTEKIAKTSPVPVFAVKSQISFSSIKNIVLPCDFSLTQRHFISKVKELQKMFDAKIHLLRINTNSKINNEQVQAKLEEYVRFYDLTNFTLNSMYDENEKDGIVNFAKESNADLIAMSTSGSADAEHWYTSSIAGDVVNHTTKLVWTCRNTDAPILHVS